MSFAVSAGAYDHFMGRFSARLAPLFADFADVQEGMRAVDVGCGPGALTVELAARLGAGSVAGADPVPAFVEACRARVPDADIRRAPAEELPFGDDEYDAALAQLVVSFMRDASAGVAEMRRVVRPGGRVAFCSWAVGEHEMLNLVWSAASELAGERVDAAESTMRYRTREELVALASSAGLGDAEAEKLTVEAGYAGFDELWDAVQTAAGPVGAYYGKLDEEGRVALREAIARRLPESGPFTLRATAWAARARA
jgi:ubiquinone/menaquinone biosynthesis C-methylase UbiE